MAEFSVISFNMQYGQRWDSDNPDNAPICIEDTIAAIKSIDADIVLLQELEQVDPQQGQVHPPPNFSILTQALPDYEAAFAYPLQDPRELPFGYGQAILSKFRLFDQETIDLPAPEIEFTFNGEQTKPTQRLMLAAKVKIAGKTVQLFNAHLQAFFMIDASSDDYRGQRDIVEQRLRGSTYPTILGGDMNSAPGEGILEQFATVGYQPVQTSKETWKRFPYVLDHLFYNVPLVLKSFAVLPTDAADHEILKAVFELPE
jgi:endonuclease/exonuclease/phosphatase family metal-dependent hydrolase